jgi:hypothetical protein
MMARKIAKPLTEEKRMELLNNELFNLVQGDQGEAHVSDCNYARDMAEFFDFVEAQLYYSREASRKMAGFLRKHRKLRQQVGAHNKPH